jgi:uncharacterized membrane-anchored protein
MPEAAQQSRPQPAPDLFNRIAEVTFAFWVLKILATTLGETAGDFFSMTLDLGYYVAFAITFAILGVILFAKVRAAGYHPVLFWSGIIATTTAGTEISDMIDRSLGLGYMWGSLLLVAGLAATLALWHRWHSDLSVDPIEDRKVEVLFWIAVIFSNSLGTAFGDFLTDNMAMSYVQGALVTATVIGIVVALHFGTRISHIALFWVAFIFTRPFGATFGDFLTKPLTKGGLDLPRGYASLIAFALMAIVLFVSVRAGRQKAIQRAG